MKHFMDIGTDQHTDKGPPKGAYSSHRKKIFDEFVKFKNDDINVTTLNISATEFSAENGSRYLLTWKEHQGATKTMEGRSGRTDQPSLFEWQDEVQTISSHETRKNLPFEDGAFDWVFCEAVIEHIGSFERQYLLLQELMRVARRGVFVTTSNRWHPIEFYTALPLLHWLPATWWKRLLKVVGKKTWASDSMLNLLDVKALQKIVDMLPEKPTCSIGHVRLMGLKAYFFLQIKKNHEDGPSLQFSRNPDPAIQAGVADLTGAA